MHGVFLYCILLNAVVSGFNVNRAMKLDLQLEKCSPKDGEEIAKDKFVAQMFKAFKEEVEMEDLPLMDTAKNLKDTDGHELLARLLFFVDTVLHETVKNKNTTEMLNNLTELSQQYKSEGPDLTSHTLWPYRCYSSELLTALDLYLSNLLLQIVSLVTNEQQDLAIFLHALAMSLPQFQDHIGEMFEPPLTSMCSLIEESSNRERTVGEILRVLEEFISKTEVANVACSSPYNSKPFCLLSRIRTTLQFFLIDYKREGSSTLMKKLAFFWFFEPSISSFCNGPSTKLKTKILASFARSEEKELRAIIKLQTEANHTKVRSFISGHILNHFTNYAADTTTLERLSGVSFSYGKNKFVEFHKRDYPSNKPTDNFLKCFNVFLTTIVEMDRAIGINSSKIKALAQISLSWFIHPDFDSNETSGLDHDFLQGLKYFLRDTTFLREIGLAVQSCGSSTCKAGSVRSSSSFCEINKILSDIKLFAVSLSSSPKIKILTPLTADYRQILRQERPWSIQSRLDELEKEDKRFRRTFSSIQSELKEHFTQAANLNHATAQHYANVLLRMVGSFFKRISEVGLEEKLSNLFVNILITGPKDSVKMSKLLAGAVVNSFNPLRWLVDVPSVQVVLDRFNPVDQISRVFREVFQQIYEKSFEISNARSHRSNSYKTVKDLLVNLTENRDVVMDTMVERSLEDHIGHEWSKEDFREHTVILHTLIEKLCDILYTRGRANRVEPQVNQAMKSGCLNIRKDVGVIGAIHNEIYEFKLEFMEVLASILRALVTKRSAAEVARIPSTTSDGRLSNLNLEVHKYRVKFQARIYIHNALRAICDEIEYKNGGTETEVCLGGILTQSRDDSKKILVTNIDECPSAQMRNLHVRIPGFPNPNKEFVEKGNIDLTKLYTGKETILEIPFSQNLPWFHRFAGNALPANPDIAMYLKQFELFLPDVTGPSQAIAYDLRIGISLGSFAKTMPSGKTKFGFSNEKMFDLSYGENREICNTGFKESPYPKLCHEPKAICIDKRGELAANEIALPLYGKWLVRASLPKGLPIPKPYPGTSFYLRAVMSVCLGNPKNVDIGNSPPVSITGSSGDCCPEGGFWNIDRDMPSVQFCLQCPPNSVPKLGGLYCHETLQESDKLRHKKHKAASEHVMGTEGIFKDKNATIAFQKHPVERRSQRNTNKFHTNSDKS